MDDEEIRRLRKMIRRTYASQPHKIKCWLALLEMYGEKATDPADPPVVHSLATRAGAEVDP
jgi:hypothetical protein